MGHSHLKYKLKVKVMLIHLNVEDDDISVTNLIDGDSISGYITVNGSSTGIYYGTDMDSSNLSITNKDNNPANYNIVIDATVNVVYPNISDETTISDYEGDYDGQAHTIGISLTSEIANATIYYCSYNPILESDWTTTPVTYTNAGAYTVYYRISLTGYNERIGYASVTINSIDSDVTITETDTGKVYDGSNFDIDYTYTEGYDGELEHYVRYYYYDSTSEAYLISPVTEAINAGQWKAEVVVVGNGNYKTTTKTYEFTITKKEEVNAQLVLDDVPFLGTLRNYQYVSSNGIADGLLENETFVIEFTISGTACGTYKLSENQITIISLSVMRGATTITANYDTTSLLSDLTVTIVKSSAEFAYSGTLINNRFIMTYDEAEFDTDIINMSSNSSSTINYYFFNSFDDANSDNPTLYNINAPINVGTYYVRCHVAADDNTYAGWSDVYTIQINERTLETWTTTTTFTYNGQTQMPVINIREYNVEVPLTYTLTSGDGISVGKHTLKVSLTNANDNYILTDDESTYVYTITARNVTVSLTDEMNYSGDIWTKDASAFTATNLVDGQSLNGTIVSTVSAAGYYTDSNCFNIDDLTIVDANDVNVTSNYNIKTSITLNIIYPSIEFEVTNGVYNEEDDAYYVTYEYDATMHYAEVVSPGAVIVYNCSGRNTYSQIGLTSVGTITVTFKLYKTNYKTTTGQIVLTIEKAELTIVPNFDDLDYDEETNTVTKEYDRKSFDFTYSIYNSSNEEINFTVSSKANYYRPNVRSYSLSSPAITGTYDVVISVTETSNYSAEDYIFTLAIIAVETPIDVPESELVSTYSGKTEVDPLVSTYSSSAAITFEYFEYYENGTADEDKVSLGATPTLDAGKYKLVVTVEGDGQFLTASKEFDYTVNPISRVVTWKNTSNIYGMSDDLDYYIPLATYYDVYGNPQSADVTINTDYIHAGTFTATATVDDSNYKLKDSDYQTNFTISTRSLSIIYSNEYYEYTGENATVTIDSTTDDITDSIYNLHDGDTITVTLTTTGYALGSYNPSKMTYVATILNSDGVDVTESYAINNRAYIVIREKPITVTFNEENVTYESGSAVVTKNFDPNGASHTVSASVNEGCTLEYIIDDVAYTEFPTTGYAKSGDYEIQYRAYGEGYETLESSFILRVAAIDYEAEFTGNFNKVYDGTVVVPSITVSNYDSTVCDNIRYYVSYAYYEYDEVNDEYSTTATASITNAGTYKLVATITAGVNYNETSIETTVTISKADVVITPYVDRLTKTFNGEEVELINNNSNNPVLGDYEYYGEGDVIISYTGQEAGYKPYFAGSYEFKFVVEETDNFNAYESEAMTLIIEKLNVQFTADSQETSYTGTNYAMQNVTISNNSLNLVLAGNVLCSYVEMGTYTSTGSIDEVVFFELEEGSKISIGEIDVTDSINPLFAMQLTINPVSAESYVTYGTTEFTYDGNAHNLVITIGDIDGSYKIKYTYNEIDYATSPSFTNAGTYRVYYLITFENYSEISGYKDIVINKKDVEVLNISDMSRTYNTNIVADPTVTTDSDGQITFTYYDANENVISNPSQAGSYKVKVSLAEGANYNAYSKTFDFEISKYDVVLVWHNNEAQYTGSEITPNVEFKKALPDSGVTLVITPATVLNVGTYNLEATLIGTNSENYTITNPSITFEVTKQVVVMPSDVEATYTGEDQNPYKSDLYTRSIDEFINVGEYVVTLTLNDTDNYIWKLADDTLTTEAQTATYVIAQKDITITDIISSDNTFDKYIEANDIKYYLISSQEYSRTSASEPVPEIIYNGMTLTSDDFKLEYVNNESAYVTGAEPSYVIVTGKGNYTGTATFEFKIVSLIFTVANEYSTVNFITYANGVYTRNTSHTVSGLNKTEYIINFKSNQTIDSFLTIFEENQRDLIVVFDANNKQVTDYSSRICTGYKIILKDTDGNVKDSLIVAVTGDVSGDGIVNSQDQILLRNYITGRTKLTGAKYIAGFINSDTVVNSQDFIILGNKISGKSDYESSYIQ